MNETVAVDDDIVRCNNEEKTNTNDVTNAESGSEDDDDFEEVEDNAQPLSNGVDFFQATDFQTTEATDTSEMDKPLPSDESSSSNVSDHVSPKASTSTDFAAIVEENDTVASASTSGGKADMAAAYEAHLEAERGWRDLGSKLDEERTKLEESRARMDKMDVVATDQITEDCQELLRLFGIPFVVAASEAEAQCAFLETVGLTEGTVTEDSDVWLFGGKVVYKNFFKKDKNVERYKIEDVGSHLRLDREKMICFAMLTGSDYTDGVDGVGGVSAFEFIHEFKIAGFDGLMKFRRRWESLARIPANESVGDKIKRRVQQLSLAESFPSESVYRAYSDPSVDESLEEFSWSTPDVPGLREFGRVKFGWTREKTDESLLPVIDKMKERRPGTLDKWVRRWSNEAIAAKKAQAIPSIRMKKMLTKMNVLPEDDVENQEKGKGKGVGKGSRNKSKTEAKDTSTNVETKANERTDASKPAGEVKVNKPHKAVKKRSTVIYQDPDSVSITAATDKQPEAPTGTKQAPSLKTKKYKPTKPNSKPEKADKKRSTVVYQDPDSVAISAVSDKQPDIPTNQNQQPPETTLSDAVIQSRSLRDRRSSRPSRRGAARATAGGGRGKRRLVSDVKPQTVVSTSPSKHPKLARPEVDPLRGDGDFSDDDEDFTRVAMMVEAASRTDAVPKWEGVDATSISKRDVTETDERTRSTRKKSYKTLAELSESSSEESD